MIYAHTGGSHGEGARPEMGGAIYFGAVGETRTHAAVINRPTPLAEEPRHQLEYYCINQDTLSMGPLGLPASLLRH